MHAPKIFAILLMLAFGMGAALAQEQYPSRTVKIVVPTSPGAVTDVIARAIGQIMSQVWRQTVIIENRAGGNETIGVEFVVKSPADGYTLLVTSNAAITAAPYLFSQLRYDPQRDLVPISMLGWVTPVMVVPSASPVRSVQELIALAKSKPGALNYGSFGTGTYSHVAMEEFKRRTGTQMTHLPYKGAGPAYTALLRNEFAVMLGNLGSAAVHADAGKARIIAAAGAQRSKARPDLPTIAESGLPGFSTGAWWGLFAPANLPRPVLDKIRGDADRMLDTPEMKKVYQTSTMELVTMTPEQLAQFIRNDTQNWAQQIKAAGIKPN